MLTEINEFQSGPDKNAREDGRIYSARRCYSENEANISVSWKPQHARLGPIRMVIYYWQFSWR